MARRSRAILIFAKEPVPGKVKTRLGRSVGLGEAARLYETFIRKTLSLCFRLSDVDKILFYDPPSSLPYFTRLRDEWGMEIHPQEGESLGDRMRQAFYTAFDLGYRSTAIIGTDSPDLPYQYLAPVFRLCEEKGMVIGPAQDGGYYLIALSSAEDDLFQDIPWSTPAVLDTTLRKARKLGLDVAMLPTWNDIDEGSDLARFPETVNESWLDIE